MEEMGVNAIRVYDVGDSEAGQVEFWERLDRSNISVMAGIELHVPTGGGWGEWWWAAATAHPPPPPCHPPPVLCEARLSARRRRGPGTSPAT